MQRLNACLVGMCTPSRSGFCYANAIMYSFVRAKRRFAVCPPKFQNRQHGREAASKALHLWSGVSRVHSRRNSHHVSELLQPEYFPLSLSRASPLPEIPGRLLHRSHSAYSPSGPPPSGTSHELQHRSRECFLACDSDFVRDQVK